jgi:hypothetical protein
LGSRGNRPKGRTDRLPVSQPQPADDHSAGHPKFCLRFLHHDFNVEKLTREQRADFALTLQRLSSLTWAEIQQFRRHTYGTEMIPRGQIKPTAPTVFDDQSRFMMFRYSGNLPMGGVRAGDTFHILWLEAAFDDLYNHGS